MTAQGTAVYKSWMLVQFWALGYAASDPDAEPPPFWLSPDALWGVAELLWVALLIRNTRKYKRLASRGDEFAAKSSLLPAFEPLLRVLVPMLLLFLGVVVGMTVVVPLGVDDSSPVFMALAFLRWFVFEAMCQGLALVFFDQALSKRTYARVAVLASVWALFYASANLVLMYWHNFHRSNIPVYFAISYEVFVCVFYFVAAYATNMARRSVRAYVNYVLVWRSIEVAGLITSLLVFTDSDNFASAYGILFLLTEIVGFPFAVHLTLTADTRYWRGLGRTLPSDSRPWCPRLMEGLLGIGGLGLGLRSGAFGDVGAGTSDQFDRWAQQQTLLPDASLDQLQRTIESNRQRMLDFAYLQLDELLGMGTAARVFKGTYRRTAVAVKVFTPPEVTVQTVKEFALELRLCSKLLHPNIVRFYGLLLCPPDLSLVFELCERGNLCDVLESMARLMRQSALFVPNSTAPAAKLRRRSAGSLEAELDRHARRASQSSRGSAHTRSRSLGFALTTTGEADEEEDDDDGTSVVDSSSARGGDSGVVRVEVDVGTAAAAAAEADGAAGPTVVQGHVMGPVTAADGSSGLAPSARARGEGRGSGAGAGAGAGAGVGAGTGGSSSRAARVRSARASVGDQPLHIPPINGGFAPSRRGVQSMRAGKPLTPPAQPTTPLPPLVTGDYCIPQWGAKLAMAVDAARAIAFLHSQRPIVLHRDIKSPNFLVTKEFRLKLADFGESWVLDPSLPLPRASGTVPWMAPELLADEPYDEKADVYSLAMLLWEILTCETPFRGMSRFTIRPLVVDQSHRPAMPKWTPRGFADLIQQGWAQDPSQRPSAQDIAEELDAMATAQCGCPVPAPRPAAPLSPDMSRPREPPKRAGRQWRIDSKDLEMPQTLPPHMIRALQSGRRIMTS